MNKLEGLSPQTSKGWSGWMHHTYHARCWQQNWSTSIEYSENVSLWGEIGEALKGSQRSTELRDRLLPLANRHAYSLGRADSDLLDCLWEDLSSSSREAAFAGLSHRFFQMEEAHRQSWINRVQSRSIEAEFDVNTATETICNLIAAGLLDRMDLFEAWEEQLAKATLPRFAPDGGQEKKEVKELTKLLSDSAIDRCLEAAIRTGEAQAVVRALAAGADPNVILLSIEPSFYTLQSALSHVIAHHAGNGSYGSLVDILLEWGAEVTGAPIEEKNRPLFLAVYQGDRETADRLLAAGAIFCGSRDALSAKQSEPDSDPFPGYRMAPEEYDWLAARFSSLCRQSESDEVVWFHIPNAQGGRNLTFLSSIVRRPYTMLPYLKGKGFQFRPTVFDLREWILASQPDGLRAFFDLVGAAPSAMNTAAELRELFSL
ncbi:MAG: hypothetical protein AAF357_02150 [Verrucomicrobiota bacterium]